MASVSVISYDKEGKPIVNRSGFIITSEGAIVTNYHVLNNADEIKIKIGEKVLNVEGVLYTDKENDIAILKAAAKGLPTVRLGEMNTIKMGEKVYVLSNPLGSENIISEGILSGIREIEPDKKILQITASISEGSSGGAVFNKEGEAIGIVTLTIKESQNLNFAMPIDLIKDKISSNKFAPLKDANIDDYKKRAEYWFYQGLAYSELGRYKAAIEYYMQAIRINSDLVGAYNNLGIAYAELGMYKEAINSYKQAIRIKPDLIGAYNNLGIAYSELGMHNEAIESYKVAIKIRPNQANSHFNLGFAYGNLKLYRESIESYKDAIRIDPAHIGALNNLGIAYGNLKMYKEAIEVYKEAISIDPGHVEAHNNLGIVYLLLNDKKSALDEYKILKTLDTQIAKELYNMINK